jgi:hypothetical protein
VAGSLSGRLATEMLFGVDIGIVPLVRGGPIRDLRR